MVQFIKKLYPNIRRISGEMGWALLLTWRVSPRLTAGVLIIEIITSLLPAGQALAGRNVINAFTDALRGGSTNAFPIIQWLLLLAVFGLADAVGSLLISLLVDFLGNDLDVKIPMLILEHSARLDYPYFEDPRFQDILDRAQRNIASQFTQFVTGIFAIGTNILQIISLIGVLVLIEPAIAPVLAVLIGPYTYFLWKLAISRYSQEYSRTTKRRWSRYFTSKLTTKASVAEVKLLDLSAILIREFNVLLNEFRNQDRRLQSREFLLGLVFAIVSALAFLGFYVRLVFKTLSGQATLGDFTIYTTATARLGDIIDRTVQAASHMLEQALYISNLKEFLEVPPHYLPRRLEYSHQITGAIEFRHVSFTYPGAKEPSLIDVSLHIKPGEAVALVGENGAGKSTLVKLLARLYDVTEGCILLDGVDLREITRESLYAQLSFVLQSFNTYEATAADNIAYGDWRALLNNRAAVEKVAHTAGVGEMIAAMPEGYDTLLGRNFGEYDLSGGQWQKIAIARAFARESALFILDEPTANLDARAEYELFTHIRELTNGRTAIIISHRFSTVSMAERIIVLDKGRVVESGTNDELIELNRN